ncbi:MAG: DUF4815 domain-containing protein [Azospirillum sp.]|nr:DUF4815 domain-containing protein [Azospirillum sp.]
MVNLAGYYNKFDASKNYESLLFRAGKVLQSSELNEVQSAQISRLKNITDNLFHDGTVIRDADLSVDPDTGAVQARSGAIYLRGAVRGVGPRSFSISVTAATQVGIWLTETALTEIGDADLLDPAVETRNYQEPGAGRLRIDTRWGTPDDGGPGTFYPVWTVVNGVVLQRESPPEIDAVALAIARYDRQSAGGFYIASGFRLTALADVGGEQVYSLSEGAARVNGREISLPHAVRLTYAAEPDLKTVAGEPHVAAGGTERVDVNHAPAESIQTVLAVKQTSSTITHGAFSGSSDLLPNVPVLSLVSVVQGGTTYVPTTDYILTSDHVDWSPGGDEPAPGTTYTVTYQYVATVVPSSPDEGGFTVSGAVAGSVIQVSYKWMRPRIDRLVLDPAGGFAWVRGVADDESPFPPAVPAGTLEIAAVRQTWGADRSIADDAVRTVAMPDLAAMQRQVSDLFNLVSYLWLQNKTALSDPATKKGVFADGFWNDELRDAGVPQNAAIVSSVATLPIIDVHIAHVDLGDVQTLALGTAAAVIAQTLRTDAMAINPYDAFDPLPARATLSPAVDYWSDVNETWTTPVTQQFERTDTYQRLIRADMDDPNHGIVVTESVSRRDIVVNSVEKIGETTTEARTLREIEIAFSIEGFGAGEVLQSVVFDGVPVTFSA